MSMEERQFTQHERDHQELLAAIMEHRAATKRLLAAQEGEADVISELLVSYSMWLEKHSMFRVPVGQRKTHVQLVRDFEDVAI